LAAFEFVLATEFVASLPPPPHFRSFRARRGKGIGVSVEWVRQCIDYLSRSGPVPAGDEKVADKVYALYLDSDLHEIASVAGVLPPNVSNMHLVKLGQGILVLQVDEVINVGTSAVTANALDDDADDGNAAVAPAAAAGAAAPAPAAPAPAASSSSGSNAAARGPAVPAGNRRLLKLFLTDGRQQVRPALSATTVLPSLTCTWTHALSLFPPVYWAGSGPYPGTLNGFAARDQGKNPRR